MKRRSPALIATATRTPEWMPELEQQIRRRAYELYEQRGKEDGHELDDWLQAESEITRTKTAIA